MSRRRFLASARRHGRGVPRHERGVRPGLRRGAGRGRRRPAWPTARAKALAGQFIVDVQTHFVRDDFKQDGPARPRQVRQAALEPGARRRERPRPLQVRELRQGDLRRQRHEGRAAVRRALRRPDVGPPDQRPDRGRPARPSTGSPARGGCSPTRVFTPKKGGLDGRGRPRDRRRSSPTAGRATRSAIRCSRPSSARTGGWTTRSSCIRSTRRP